MLSEEIQFIKEKLGNEIKKNRLKANLSQKKLSELSSVSKANISLLERSKTQYTIDSFIKIISVLDRVRRKKSPKINVGLVYKNLYKFGRKKKCNSIERTIAKCLELPIELIRSSSMEIELVKARFYGFWMMREFASESTKNIGERYNRDHSTVSVGIKRLGYWLETNDPLARDFHNIRKEVGRRLNYEIKVS